MFVAIIVIALILAGFVLISGAWKIFTQKPVALVSYGKDGSEKDFFKYMNKEYGDLAEVRFAVVSGEDVNGAIAEVGYEEG
jgi:hypothetical protein